MCRPVKLNSTKLKNEFLKVFKDETLLTLSQVEIRREYLSGYQAHHIIPVEVLENYVEESDYEFYNRDWNCLMVAQNGDAIVHNGSHPRYNEFVNEFIMQLHEVFPDVTFQEIAVGIAAIIRDSFNDSLAIERIKKTKGMSMDQFAKKYLWDVYC